MKEKSRNVANGRSALPRSIKKRGDKLEKHFQRHFRKVRNSKYTGHPVYVIGEDGKDFLVLGTTKSPETNGIFNIPLTKNPDPEKEKLKIKAYFRPKVERLNKGVESYVQKGWSLSAKDKRNLSFFIESLTANKKRK